MKKKENSCIIERNISIFGGREQMEQLRADETVSGVIENVVYRNESNDYTVFEIVDANECMITCVGIIPSPTEGENVVLKGQWAYHREFGKQFSFVTYEKSLPTEIDGMIQYLSSRTVKGVGPVTACKIVKKFGTDTFDVIENHPEWLADIPGITLKKAGLISESFRAQTELRGIMLFLRDYMGTGEATRIYRRFGAAAIGIVKENPYILCRGDYGIGFEKADGIAASFGFPRDSEKRIESGIEYILSYNGQTNGHTCLPTDKLIPAVSGLLELPEDIIIKNLKKLVGDRIFVEYKADDTVYVMSEEINDQEKYIARRLATMGGEIVRISNMDISALIEKVERRVGVSYAPMQREAIYRCINDGVTIITGGPGTGKTTIVKAILSIFGDLGMKTVLAAPTGRAAKRLSETTGEEAKTVHRLLEMERTEGKEYKFARNLRNPLDEKVFIVDEASMIDLSLMNALIRALPKGARLILIGDADQLPSVGAGNVLDDLIDSGRIETIRLTDVFRQSKESLIITNAHRINKGESPRLTVTDNDFFFVRRENERDIAATVSDLIINRLPRTYGKAISEGIQVITPSKKGAGGVEILNNELQAKVNPPLQFKKEKSAHGVIFREGDRVMQIANNYEIEWEKNGIPGLGLFNGDIGVIESIDLKGEVVCIWFEDRYVRYPFTNLDELELSYAITVHKSQGSEYPVVIIPMYSCAPMLMTRNLLYTAVTRARRMVILVGRSDIPERMVRNNREVLRYTTLKQRLKV